MPHHPIFQKAPNPITGDMSALPVPAINPATKPGLKKLNQSL